MRIDHKSNCALIVGAMAKAGYTPHCSCGARRKVKPIARQDDSFLVAAMSDGQMSLGDGNYRRAMLHSGE